MTFTYLPEQVTEKLLRMCYNCSDVQRCETEQKCLECFAEHAEYEPDAEDIELREAFRMYAY